MQDKQGSKYCIACSELDSDAVKDDPGAHSLSTVLWSIWLFAWHKVFDSRNSEMWAILYKI